MSVRRRLIFSSQSFSPLEKISVVNEELEVFSDSEVKTSAVVSKNYGASSSNFSEEDITSHNVLPITSLHSLEKNITPDPNNAFINSIIEVNLTADDNNNQELSSKSMDTFENLLQKFSNLERYRIYNNRYLPRLSCMDITGNKIKSPLAMFSESSKLDQKDSKVFVTQNKKMKSPLATFSESPKPDQKDSKVFFTECNALCYELNSESPISGKESVTTPSTSSNMDSSLCSESFRRYLEQPGILEESDLTLLPSNTCTTFLTDHTVKKDNLSQYSDSLMSFLQHEMSCMD